MFENFTQDEKLILHQALVALVLSGAGVGFHNRDQGHPAYRSGARGKIDEVSLGDSPERNRLFQMLFTLSSQLGPDAMPSVSNWGEFCVLALEGYERQTDEARKLREPASND